jgi:PAS domain S-box-containing protein
MIEASVDCVITIDAHSTILEFNAAAEQTFGYAREEVIGKPLTEMIIPPSLREAHLRGMAALLKGGTGKLLGKRVEMPAMRSDGSEIPVELTVTRIASQNPPLFTAYLRDITDRKRAEERLKQAEDRIRLVIDTIPTMAWTLESNGALDFVNQRWLDYTGLSLAEALKEDSKHVVHPEDLPRALEKWFPNMAAGKPSEDEMRLRRADGTYRWFLVRISPLRDAEGNVITWYGVSTDIEDRKQAEMQARTLIDAIPHQIWSGPADGTIDYCNDRWRAYMGVEREELNGDVWQRMLHPEDRDRVLKAWRESVSNGTPYEQEERHRGAKGKYRWFLARGIPKRDAEGRIVRWYGTNTDIEDRKRTEEALRKSEKLFTAFMDHLPGFAWIKDVEGRYVYINETFLQLRNALGKTDAELWPAEIASTYRANDNQVIQTKNTLQTIEPFPKDPEQGCQIVSKFPIFDQDGAVVMVGGTSVDISELIQAEKALEVQALRYKTLMETSTDSIYVLDAEGNLQEANAAFLRQRGYSAAEVKGLNIADWDAQWSREQLQQRLRMLVGSSAVFETRHRSKDGSLFDVEVSATSVRIGGKDLFFCVTRDITGRKKAERALRESETRFRELAENIREVFWMSDPENTRMLYISPTYETIWGRSREALYASPASWMEAIHPEDKERIVQTRSNRASTEPHDNTYRIVRPDGSVRWIRDRGFPVRDENGAVVRFAGIAEDITEQKRAEERLREYEKVVEGLEEMIIVIDRDYRYLIANTAYLKYHGMEREQLIGRVVPDLLDRAVFETVVKPRFDECLEGRSIRYEIKYRYEQRGERDMLVSYFPIEGRSGIDRVACVLQDITERKQAEAAQERGLSLVLATVESTADGILVVNTEGKIETFNRLFARMWHLPDEVLASKEDARALECVLDQLIEPEKFLEKVSYLYQHPEEESFDRLIFKDGRIFERYSRPQLIGGKVAGRVWSFRDVTERRRAAEELEKANHQLRILSRQLFHIQEEERRHLARELHDEIGQTLTAAKINLKIIAPDVPPQVIGRLNDSVQLLDRLLRQVRELSLDLRPPLLDELGLVPTLRWLVDQQAQRAGLRVTFSANVDGLEIDPDIQTACFRVAQEGITNIIRHSGAKSVTVELRCETERLWLSVRDDGAGFDPSVLEHTLTPHSTLGLVGMKERTLLVRGGLEVQSAPGQGTEIRAWFPLVSHEPHRTAETE